MRSYVEGKVCCELMFWTPFEIGVRIIVVDVVVVVVVVVSHYCKYVCCIMLLLLLEFVITVKPVLNGNFA